MMDHYRTLGIARGATAAEVAAAYRRGLAALREEMAAGRTPDPARLDELRAAWTTLSDPATRAVHDAALGAPPPPPPPAWPARATQPAVPRPVQFEFTGSGGEYFRIWIVNLLLSIITLGIYSAWAKVRRERYFHRNLRLDGSTFDYHGRPLAILKGRLVAVGLLVLLGVAEKVNATVYALVLLALVPVVPWLAVRALRFRAHYTSYRGLRFGFDGAYRQALLTFVGFGLLSGITFGLAYPLFQQRLKRFLFDSLRFGQTPFACALRVGEFYRIYAMPIVAFLLLGLAAGIVIGVAGPRAGQAIVPPLLVFGGIAVFILLRPYLAVRTSNALWNSVTVGGARFSSDLKLGGYFAVAASNAVLLAVTLGLFWPWARVRMARYRADHLSLEATMELDSALAGEETRASAVGAEAAEMFDFDISV